MGACTPVRLARCGDGAEGLWGVHKGDRNWGCILLASSIPLTLGHPIKIGASH